MALLSVEEAAHLANLVAQATPQQIALVGEAMSNSNYLLNWLDDLQRADYDLHDLEQSIIRNDIEMLEAALNDPDQLQRSVDRNEDEIQTLFTMSSKEFGDIHALRLWTLMVHNDFLQQLIGTD